MDKISPKFRLFSSLMVPRSCLVRIPGPDYPTRSTFYTFQSQCFSLLQRRKPKPLPLGKRSMSFRESMVNCGTKATSRQKERRISYCFRSRGSSWKAATLSSNEIFNEELLIDISKENNKNSQTYKKPELSKILTSDHVLRTCARNSETV